MGRALAVLVSLQRLVTVLWAVVGMARGARAALSASSMLWVFLCLVSLYAVMLVDMLIGSIVVILYCLCLIVL